MVGVNTLLNHLPPYQGNDDMIVRKQSLRDIKRLTKEAHQEFAPHYDLIQSYFPADDRLPEYLFDFLKKNVHYKMQGKEFQSIESPAAILAKGKGDCKHYASFAAGILDSVNRAGRGQFDWAYRFGTWNGEETGHVFVVIYEPHGEIWIDPAPIPGLFGDVPRTFNDRKSVPDNDDDITVSTMALYKVSGPAAQAPAIVSSTVTFRKDSKAKDPCGCNSVGRLPYEADYVFSDYTDYGQGGGIILLEDPTMVKDDGSMRPDLPAYVYDSYIPGPVTTTMPSGSYQEVAETRPDTTTDVQTPEGVQTMVDPNVQTATAEPDTAATPGTWDRIVDFAKANPVPTAVIVGGGLWLLFGRKKKKKRA